jgi:hypothetical protein
VTAMSGNDQRNWFERLSGKIPGYSGYVDKERRRDTDKRQRELLADRVRGLKAPLNEVMRELSTGGRLFEIGPVDHLTKKLDRVENRIRYASYGYSGFFDVVKIQQTQLDAIYQFDLSLVEQVDALEAKVNELKSNAGTADGLKAAAAAAEGAIDQLEHTFDGRYNAVNNFGQEAVPQEPAPLFNS